LTVRKSTTLSAVSKPLAIVIVAALLAVVAVSGIYVADSTSYLRGNGISSSNSTNAASSTAITSGKNKIAIEALSLDPSTSNLSSTVNVNAPPSSPLVRIDLYLNGTFVGSCNYTRAGAGWMMDNGLAVVGTRSWGNGTYSMTFSVSPGVMPMMSEIPWSAGSLYMVRMVGMFQNGATYNVSSTIRAGGQNWSPGGMMAGGNWSPSGIQGIMSGMMGSYYSVRSIPLNEAMSAVRSPPPSYAKVFTSNDTISFSGTQNVTIVAAGMMSDDAGNLTGMNKPPAYATDDVFVVYGLIDPTLVIPSGASVNLLFVNLDDDMYHNFVMTSLAPPYYYMPMEGMMSSNSSSWYGDMGNGMMGGGMMGGGGSGTAGSSGGAIFATMMPVLSPVSQGLAYYYATSFTLRSYGGSYWYICTYPGHAQGGMYGKILVVNG
jgi:rusticyanin